MHADVSKIVKIIRRRIGVSKKLNVLVLDIIVITYNNMPYL